ncbi:hypothetical protein AB0B25_19100 [Nocardia sp. NPDC049190]|uniref:hypothetical protein n=1 Tax=Nocardia sp. NPDC049190 TaxID=3155650 RepID=UPI003410DC02
MTRIDVHEHRLRFRLSDSAGHEELMRLVSIFHRRGIEVMSLHFDRASGGGGTVDATVMSTRHGAEIVVRTCADTVHFLEARVTEPAEWAAETDPTTSGGGGGNRARSHSRSAGPPRPTPNI